MKKGITYVLSKNKEPLMSTKNGAKVRLLLKQKKAKVVKTKPFTIMLLYETTSYTQDITLGIDSGYNHIGFSAVTEKEEVISGEVKLLDDVSERIKNKKMYRNQRRKRLRYRQPRFDNRKRDKGWLAPSIEHKYQSHLKIINKIKEVLPISETIIEVANFDIQKIKNPQISNKKYQEGEQQGFFNLREYILHRDNHKCQNPNCKNKDKKPILEVHHIGFWKKDRSDRPGNLTALCNQCHTPSNHKKNGFLYGWQPKVKNFKTATFMSVVRWKLVNNLNCQYTYGYITKSKRIELGIEKTHYNDAFCIAKGKDQKRTKPFLVKQIRRNNRSLEKFYDAKYIDARTGKKVAAGELHCGRRTRNKTLNQENLKKYRKEKKTKGRRQIRRTRYPFQPNDVVLFKGKKYIVKGTQNKGRYVKLKDLKKVVKPEQLTHKRYMQGLVFV